jgi:MFS family permease
LRQRNFRLFFGGQVVSMAGTWMQTVALSWLVLQLSGNSGLAVGLVFSFQYLPTLFLGAYGGVFIDAFDKRKVMAVTQVIQTTAAVLLAVLTFTGVVELWMVYAITMLNGLALVVDNPARVTIVSELVGDEDLSNALGLNNAVVQTARIAGPALAGVVILVSGTAMCFAVNALSFLAMLAALAALDPSKMHRKPPLGRHKGQMRDGLHYIWNRRDLRAALLLMTVIGTLSFNMSVITPLMAKLEFDGDAATLSWMIIALGCGALVGALVFASRASVTPRLMVYSGLVFGGLLVLCALTHIGGVPRRARVRRCRADRLPHRDEFDHPVAGRAVDARSGDGRLQRDRAGEHPDRWAADRTPRPDVRTALGVHGGGRRCVRRDGGVRHHVPARLSASGRLLRTERAPRQRPRGGGARARRRTGTGTFPGLIRRADPLGRSARSVPPRESGDGRRASVTVPRMERGA